MPTTNKVDRFPSSSSGSRQFAESGFGSTPLLNPDLDLDPELIMTELYGEAVYFFLAGDDLQQRE
jgi:hypothetical protein